MKFHAFVIHLLLWQCGLIVKAIVSKCCGNA